MPASLRDQHAALTRTFLARFFENEITRGTDDLRTSFFWLISILALPGLFIPLLMSFSWSLLGLLKGSAALQSATRGDKAFYLGFAMIATGIVTVIAWNSLLPDRRDRLILGAMPVTPFRIVAAKLTALMAYIALVAVGMHAVGSVSFGFGLATAAGFEFLIRGILSHFLVSCAASAFIFFSVTAVQGLLLAAGGPRLFTRISPMLQVAVVGLIVLGILAMPVIDQAVVPTLARGGPRAAEWILWTPPVWFLGLYEWGLGARDPVLTELARIALLVLPPPIAVTLITYPLAYRRLMAALNETTDHRSRRWERVASLLARSAGREPQARALAQFYLATIARVERHRFVLAIGIGLAAAWSLPAVLALVRNPPAAPRLDLLSLSLATMVFMLVTLRIAAALPSDVGPAWLFDLTAPPRDRARAVVERLMFALAVMPAVLFFAPLYWWLWGAQVAIVHTLVGAVMGALLIQLLLWRYDGVPCAKAWDPEGIAFGRFWMAYLGGFIFFTVLVPDLELLLFRSPVASALLIANALLLSALVRYASLRQRTGMRVWEPAPGDVLGLN